MHYYNNMLEKCTTLGASETSPSLPSARNVFQCMHTARKLVIVFVSLCVKLTYINIESDRHTFRFFYPELVYVQLYSFQYRLVYNALDRKPLFNAETIALYKRDVQVIYNHTKLIPFH